jgi:hypothetical protein
MTTNVLPNRSLREVKELIARHTVFFPFHFLLENEPLLKFVYHEKCCFSGEMVETRQAYVFDSETKTKRMLLGYLGPPLEPEKNIFHPQNFFPFKIKGIWLPVSEGTLYSTLNQTSDCPLIKTENNRELILFLIHPESEALYSNLLKAHKDQIISVSALSLSSIRSVLIAFPNAENTFIPVMIKLTLNKKSGGVLRVLTERTCRLSVGNSGIFSQKLATKNLSFTIFEEPLAFIPKGHDAGMIYRQLPTFLKSKCPDKKMIYPIPLFALLSVKNRDLFREIVRVNGGTVTQFLRNSLLLPYAEIYIELLMGSHMSIEAHPQNLLLLLNNENHTCGFIYRDMEGVIQICNEESEGLLLNKDELEHLPMNLKDPSFYYFNTYVTDASFAMEQHFVIRTLGPLTRQLVKDHRFNKADPVFNTWYNEMAQHHFLKNWTLADLNKDDYQKELPIENFHRYGYVEFLFMECLIGIIRKKKLMSSRYLEQKRKLFFEPEPTSSWGDVAPCTKTKFFSSLIWDLLINSLI